ncbi:SusC/RagA family TonB-linked outer membrane protein [Sediminitomix flava]|uniref:TonB-linked SusC/RagA family outer membrane protein n=1 Tax=Sediminitomix flava TaxID=379075 RepID=A0A315ZLD3_SEDFL|nr:TonB-dependent receptor [Sediminitomix flava]PWJ34984.1 TonB-linked SusC/RagA family outer membrane protein [Sediminitomix flava]
MMHFFKHHLLHCKSFWGTILLVFLTIQLQAQNYFISGTVVDEIGQPLPGVNVILLGTSKGTSSDFNGKFTLSVPDKNAKLEFSSVGHKKQIISLDGRTKLNIQMEVDLKTLEEIVVIGYGEIKKKELTGSVGRVDSETLIQTPTADLGTALQGQIAGVNVQASSGDPGAPANIQIRGLSSVTGANAPLFVVDGIPYDGNPRVSPNEIESIDVLKDAASASVYGTRGAGGVILITTKSGKAGQMKVALDSYYGFQKITSDLPLMGIEDYLYSFFLSKSHLNGTPIDDSWTQLENNRYDFTNNTNLEGVLQNDYAPVQNHSLSVSGGKDDLTYSIVGTYFQQEGTLINSSYDRMNVRANATFKKKKWTINTGLGFRIEERQYAPYQLLLEAFKYKPFQREIDPSQSTIEDAGSAGSTEAVNLGNMMYKLKQTDFKDGNHLNYNLRAQYRIAKGFNFVSRVGGGFTDNTRVRINPLFRAYDFEGELVQMQNRSGVYNESETRSNWAWENSFNYQKKFNGHQIKTLALFSLEEYVFTSFFGRKYDLISNDLPVLNAATLDPDAGSRTGWNQDKSNSLVGMLGRLQYDYKGRYLLSVSARRDGSSRFSEDARWGIFPSISGGWNISEESFFKGLSDVWNVFKIRASHGTTGNQNFLDYSNAATITLTKDYVYGGLGNESLALGATQTKFANPNVQWETTIQSNLGIDLAFFNNKLTFTADIYDTNKEDMLFPVLLAPSTGAGSNSTVVLNVGNMNNRGLELSTNYRHIGENGFNWSIGATYAKNQNTVTKMSGSNKMAFLDGSTVADGVPNEDKVSVLREGYEAGAFFLIETDGVISDEEELQAYQEAMPGFASTAKVGDLKYVDQDGDGEITIEDRVYKGSGMPDFEVGLNLSAGYKGFDISMQWYGAIGGEVLNGSKAYSYKYGTHQDLVYQWSSANTASNIPAYRGRDHENYRGYTDYWLEDGSFARLRNLSIGYTLPNNASKALGLSKFKVYLAGQNLITITNYSGFDPEVGNDGLNTRGIDKGNYPISASYRAGIQLEF